MGVEMHLRPECKTSAFVKAAWCVHEYCMGVRIGDLQKYPILVEPFASLVVSSSGMIIPLAIVNPC